MECGTLINSSFTKADAHFENLQLVLLLGFLRLKVLFMHKYVELFTVGEILGRRHRWPSTYLEVNM